MEYIRYSPDTINKETHPHLRYVTKCWQTKDGKYDILFDEVKGFKHLRIRRIDDAPIHNYMDMQQIKNDLLGKDVIAIEVYPKSDDFKNGSNTYHLWSWEGMAVPNLSDMYEYNSL